MYILNEFALLFQSSQSLGSWGAFMDAQLKNGRRCSLSIFDYQDVAAKIHHGLTMPEGEKLSRHAALYDVVRTHTSHTWAAILVKMLLGLVGTQNMTRHTPELDRAFLKEKYDAASQRLLMFDYDVRGVTSHSVIKKRLY